MRRPDPQDAPRLGYIYAALAAGLWAVSGSAAKFLFLNGITPFQLVQMRLTIAAGILFIWLLVCKPRLLKVRARDLPYLAVFGVVGMAGVQFAYLFAISRLPVAVAILLQYLAPAFIAMHAVVFLHERLAPATAVALCGALGGCYLVVGAYNLDLLSLNRAGIAAGLAAALGFAWYSVHGEIGMRRYDPWTVLFYALACGAATWNLAYPSLEGFRHAHPAKVWAWIAYIGILGTLVPFGLYLESVNLVRSTRASITATLEPIMAGLLAFVFLDEILGIGQLVGAAGVIGAIVWLQLHQERDAKAPAVLRAPRSAPGPSRTGGSLPGGPS
jgi:drug/metabolite transporter (DMT)-like permease